MPIRQPLPPVILSLSFEIQNPPSTCHSRRLPPFSQQAPVLWLHPHRLILLRALCRLLGNKRRSFPLQRGRAAALSFYRPDNQHVLFSSYNSQFDFVFLSLKTLLVFPPPWGREHTKELGLIQTSIQKPVSSFPSSALHSPLFPFDPKSCPVAVSLTMQLLFDMLIWSDFKCNRVIWTIITPGSITSPALDWPPA